MNEKVLVTYSSVTGNTKKLAEGIYNSINHEDKTILPIKDVENFSIYDVICLGYWVDKAMPNKEALACMEKLKNKNIFLFATLGAFPDGEHARISLVNGENIVKEENNILGSFICQGALSPKLIETFKNLPQENTHALTPKKLFKYEIASKHPSLNDINLCCERVNEKLQYHFHE